MNRFVLLLLAIFLCTPGAARAAESSESLSQRTKEAVNKVKEVAAIPGKIVQSLTGGEKPEPKPEAEKKEPADSFAVPAKKPQPPSPPRYSAAGKRDPFGPQTPRSQPVRRPPESLSPLERYELGQLKLVGIVWNIQEPRAMVEDSAGLGYSIKVGTPIGPNDGKVMAIQPAEVVIEEVYTDFYGARKSRSVRMKLPSQ